MGEVWAEGAWTRTRGGGGGGSRLREPGERGVRRVGSCPSAPPSALAPSREGARARRTVLRVAEPHPPGRFKALCVDKTLDSLRCGDDWSEAGGAAKFLSHVRTLLGT